MKKAVKFAEISKKLSKLQTEVQKKPGELPRRSFCYKFAQPAKTAFPSTELKIATNLSALDGNLRIRRFHS
jgi:hypothetical protein